jgi:hypothetical protein
MAEAVADPASDGRSKTMTARLLGIDAGLEALIAAFLIVLAAASPTSDGWRRPSWLSNPALVAVALVFAATAVTLAVLARYAAHRSTGRHEVGLLTLGIVNIVAALALLVWVVVDDAPGAALRTFAGVGAIAVLALGAAQSLQARRQVRYRSVFSP